MGRGRSEQREHAVAGQSRHLAAEALDRAFHRAHGLGDDLREVLGVKALAQGGRADDVGEQRR